MRNRIIEQATTAIVVTSLVFGMLLSVPSASDFSDVTDSTQDTSPSTNPLAGLLAQPVRF